MQDIFYAILIFWVIYKISNSFNNSARRNPQQTYTHKREGEVKVEDLNKKKPKNNNDDSEYVDYEEIK